jgi:hypothetical protein
MNVLEQIVEWAKTIPSWQGEAVRRLLQQEVLTDDDTGQLYAMLKATNGLVDPAAMTGTPMPIALTFSPPTTKDHCALLKKMHSLQNVNALAANQV